MNLNARERYFRRKTRDQTGKLFLPALPRTERLRHPLDEADKEEEHATKHERTRPRPIPEVARLHGQDRRYARVQEYALQEAVRDPIIAVRSLYLAALLVLCFEYPKVLSLGGGSYAELARVLRERSSGR